MKARILVFAAVAMLIGGWYMCIYQPPYDGLRDVPRRPMIAGHYGFGEEAPRETMLAAQMAIDAGMEIIDIDIQPSADGVPMVFHDFYLQKATHASGSVSSLNEIQLRDIAMGRRFTKFPVEDQRISSLEDFVATFATSGAKISAEIKEPGLRATGIEFRVAALIQKYDAHNTVYISSYNPVVIYRLKKIDPRIHVTFSFYDGDWSRAHLLKKETRGGLYAIMESPWYLRITSNRWGRRAVMKFIQSDALTVRYPVSSAVLKEYREAGYPIQVWNLNDRDSIRAMLQQGVTTLISNKPLLAKQLRDAAFPQ